MGEPLSLSGLREKVKPWTDVEIEGVGTLRVGRMSLIDRIEFLESLDAVKKDTSGRPVSTKENIKLFVTLVCKSLVGPTGEKEFDSQQGFDLIMALDDADFYRLFDTVMANIKTKLGEDGSNPIQDELDQAKND